MIGRGTALGTDAAWFSGVEGREENYDLIQHHYHSQKLREQVLWPEMRMVVEYSIRSPDLA